MLTVLLGMCCVAVPGASGAEPDDLRVQLAEDLQASQAQLSAVEAGVSRERGQLAEALNAAQSQVLALREQAVAARRLADEETLSLSQIETRLQGWQDQSRFQTQLLAGFLERNGLRTAASEGTVASSQDLAAFSSYLNAQYDRLYPKWQSERLVDAQGQLQEVRLLSLGPVQWFWNEAAQQAGIARQEGALLHAALQLDGAGLAGIQALYRTGTGAVTLDPSLSRVLALADDEETLLQHLQKGGIWVIPILLFALFATVIAVLKGVSLYRLPALQPALAERVETSLGEGKAAMERVQEQVHGPQAELLRIALAPQTAGQREDRLYATLLEQRNKLERWLGAIAMTASVSPLLGLLGTVSGMIATFRLMTLFGAGDASSVSAGISEALVTTELGLVVAIPALLAHALMSRKVKSYFSQLENDAVHLSQLPVQAART